MGNTYLERAAHHAKNDVSDAIDQLISTIEDLEAAKSDLEQEVEKLKDKVEELENKVSEYEGRNQCIRVLSFFKGIQFQHLLN